MTLYTIATWLIVVAGILPALLFLAAVPRERWFHADTLNASGWIIVVALAYARSLLLMVARLVTGHPSVARPVVSWWVVATSLLIGAAADALLWQRVVDYMKFRRYWREPRKGKGDVFMAETQQEPEGVVTEEGEILYAGGQQYLKHPDGRVERTGSVPEMESDGDQERV